jgi:TolA-binding protein
MACIFLAACNRYISAINAVVSSHLFSCCLCVLAAKKRPAWDTKGRLEDMEVAMSRHLVQNTNLQQQILQSNERIALLESLNCQLKGTVQQKDEMTSQAHDEIQSLRRRLR